MSLRLSKKPNRQGNQETWDHWEPLGTTGDHWGPLGTTGDQPLVGERICGGSQAMLLKPVQGNKTAKNIILLPKNLYSHFELRKQLSIGASNCAWGLVGESGMGLELG